MIRPSRTVLSCPRLECSGAAEPLLILPRNHSVETILASSICTFVARRRLPLYKGIVNFKLPFTRAVGPHDRQKLKMTFEIPGP